MQVLSEDHRLTPAADPPAHRHPRWPSVAAFAGVVAAFVIVWYVETDVDSVFPSAWWLGGGLTLAALVLACRPAGVHWNTRPVGALVDWLSMQWKGLAIAYAALVLLWIAAVAALRVPVWLMLFETLFSRSTPSGDSSFWWENALTVGVFVGLQLVFISGVGRIRIRRDPAPPWKLTASIAVFALFIGLATWATVAGCLQMMDRIDAASGRAGFNMFGGASGMAALTGSWLFWLGVGWALARGVPRDTALGRMIMLLFAGSWIEFAVALPVELVTRDRTKDCPCASGSWIALVVAGPLLLWAIGPAVVLLYRHEWLRTLEDPAHARRVLQRKSRRSLARV